MILLMIAITIALLITIVLPLGASFWVNKKLGVGWRVVMYGALGYFVVQALTILIFNGYQQLLNNGILTFSDQTALIVEIVMSVTLAALLGVLIRWAAMKYLNEELDNLESAYGLGLGYGAAESIMLVGLPLLMTFVTMLGNMNIDPANTNLDPELAQQIINLWEVPAYLPLAGSLERLSAFIMHITVTILVLQVFKRGKYVYLAAAFGVELLMNGLVVGLSEAGLQYGWVILVSILLAAGNIYLLYLLGAHKVDFEKAGQKDALKQDDKKSDGDADDAVSLLETGEEEKED
jgi:uncharacterized membrane protein YhfC